MSGESLESLLEFLTISGRVAVVQLEPPRARAFAAALRLAMEFKEAALARTEQDVAFEAAAEREACAAYLDDVASTRWSTHGMYWRDSLRGLADEIRARGAK